MFQVAIFMNGEARVRINAKAAILPRARGGNARSAAMH